MRTLAGDADTIARAALQSGHAIPERIANAPKLLPGNLLFFMAFSDLDTERAPGHLMPGPIPWSAVERYARLRGIRDRRYFHEVIRRVDDWHMKSMGERLGRLGKTPGSRTPSRIKGR